MRQLAKAVSDHIIFRIQGANFTASRISAMLGQFQIIAPEGTIAELIAFLDFCAYGTTSPEQLSALQRDGVITKTNETWMLSQDGSELKAKLGLANASYRGHTANAMTSGNQLDDLLGEME
jgi:hypothetical protein